MTPDIVSQKPPPRWLEHPIILGVLFSIILPLASGATSVWYAQADTAKEIEAIEVRQVQTDARVDANKRERDEQIKELRKEVVTKEMLDEKWKTVEKIDRTVDRLLELQLKERR